MGNSTKNGSSAKLEIQDCFSVSIWQSPPAHSTNLEWPFLYTHSAALEKVHHGACGNLSATRAK